MLNYNNNYNNKIDLASFSKIFDESFSNFTAFYSDLNNENILYRNMYAKVRHLSSKIKSRTKNDGNKILLFLDSGLDFVTVFYAVIYSRNIPILINNKVKTEINGLIQKYDYIMTDEKNVQNVRKYLNVAHKKDTIIYVDDSYSEPLGEQINDAGDNFRYCFNSNDTMLYLFTSGSTGKPKLVKKTFLNIFAEISYLKSTLNISASDTFLSLVPTFHIYGLLFSVILPMFAGSRVLLDIPFSPLNIIEDALLKKEVNVLIGIPANYMSISTLIDGFEHKDFAHIKYCVTSTSKIDDEIIEAFHQKIGVKIIEFYGSTETGGIAYHTYGTNWNVFDFVKWKLDDEDILCLQSPTVSSVNDEANDDWYVTNDVVERINEDEFVLLGRLQQIAKIAGNRVSTIEVETLIKKNAHIKDCVVIVKKAKTLRGESLTSYIVSQSNNMSDENLISEVKAYCRNKMTAFKIPNHFIVVKSIPRGVNDKILFKK